MRVNAKQVRRAAIGCTLAAAALVAACGGGTQANDFTPNRIIAFGDETSVIDDFQANGNGRKYTVNATVSATDATLDCKANLLWIQVLADIYNLVFPQCNPGTSPVANPASRIRAQFGARAGDLATQIAAQNAESAIKSGDMVTVLVGGNDILAEYAQYPAVSEVQLTADVQAAGEEVGRQVNLLADMGAKVIVSTIPDVGDSPYAIAEKAAHIDTDRQALILRLTSAYNQALRASLANDGRRIGLVLMDEFVESAAKFVGVNGFANTTTGVCDLTKSHLVPPSVLDCTNLTLITNGSPTTFLWADDRHISAGAQTSLGNLAVTRARNNPF